LLSARGIERLARKMYEASCPAGAPWPHQGWNARQSWLAKAREAAGVGPAAERTPLWRKPPPLSPARLRHR